MDNAQCCDGDGSCDDGDDEYCCNDIFYCSTDAAKAEAKGGIVCPADDTGDNDRGNCVSIFIQRKFTKGML